MRVPSSRRPSFLAAGELLRRLPFGIVAVTLHRRKAGLFDPTLATEKLQLLIPPSLTAGSLGYHFVASLHFLNHALHFVFLRLWVPEILSRFFQIF